jgi:hypothetical protein
MTTSRLFLLTLAWVTALSGCDGGYRNERRFPEPGAGAGVGGWGDGDKDDAPPGSSVMTPTPTDPWHPHDCSDAGSSVSANPDAAVVAQAPDAAEPSPPDSGLALADAAPAPDASPLPDAASPDAGFAPDASPPDVGPPDSGVECVTNNDCPLGTLCSTSGRCVLAACADLTTEAACLARQDCLPIYAGMNCVDMQGRQCNPGDTNCVCATYSFAVCAAR